MKNWLIRQNALWILSSLLGSCAAVSFGRHSSGDSSRPHERRRHDSSTEVGDEVHLTYSMPHSKADASESEGKHLGKHGRHASSGHSSHGHSAGHAASGHDSHGLGYSLCLFGAVAFNMSALYLINHEDPGIVYATWEVLSMTLSIFVAVMAYATIRAIFVDKIAAPYGAQVALAASGILFLAIYVINEAVLYVMKGPKFAAILNSGAALSCHVLGFSACYSFADLQHAAFFRNSVWGRLLIILIAAMVLTGLAIAARKVHKWVETLHEAEREHLEDVHWEKEVEACEDEAVSLCMGYLLVQTAAYEIRGSFESVDAMIAPEDTTQRQVGMIAIWCFVFFLLTLLGYMLANWYLRKEGEELSQSLSMSQSLQSLSGMTSTTSTLTRADTLNYEKMFLAEKEEEVKWHVRVLMIVLHTLGVAMAWCVLLMSEWQVYSLGFSGSRIAACMLVGIILTLSAFAMIFVLEWIANHVHTQKSSGIDPKKVFRSMTLALGIVIGFAWERSFHVGLHDIAHAFHFTHAAEDWVSHAMAVGLIVIVTPAWAMYVFPMVKQSEKACHSKYGSFYE